MTTYTVTSTRFVDPEGSTVTEEQLAGCNIGALVEAGHLTPLPDAPTAPAVTSPPPADVLPPSPAVQPSTVPAAPAATTKE